MHGALANSHLYGGGSASLCRYLPEARAQRAGGHIAAALPAWRLHQRPAAEIAWLMVPLQAATHGLSLFVFLKSSLWHVLCLQHGMRDQCNPYDNAVDQGTENQDKYSQHIALL